MADAIKKGKYIHDKMYGRGGERGVKTYFSVDGYEPEITTVY